MIGPASSLRNQMQTHNDRSVERISPTVVLIPGLLSDQFVWKAVADRISSEFGIPPYVADLARCDSISEMADNILQNTAGTIVAIGHSMGGRVALEMARIAPQRVSGLVLANTGHHPKREGEEIKRQKMIDLGHRSMEQLADAWLPDMVNRDRVNDGALMVKLREMVLRSNAAQHERHMRALINRPNATKHLEDIRCPVLLIAGRQDTWSPIAQHKEIADIVQDSLLHIVEDAGHFAPVEQPQLIAALIADWIRVRWGLDSS